MIYKKEKTMKITFYDSAEEAERKLRVREVEHLIQDHDLRAGEKVDPDSHKSNEWIIFGPGRGACRVQIMKEVYAIALKPKKATVVHVPGGKTHSLEATTNLSYTVLRDGLD
jgi:hypothetical protein